MKVYAVSGLGADERVFKNLSIPKGFELVHLPWLIPEKNEALHHYIQRMLAPINQNEMFVLMGLSFGGIIVQEMNQYLKPEHNLLISTIKNRSELPPLLKIGANTKLYKAIPMQFFTNDSLLSYTFFRKLYDSRMPKLTDFFTVKDPLYLQWSIHQILNWKPTYTTNNFSHIHGANDFVFPIKNIKHAEIVPKGTHLMVLQNPKPINSWLEKKLKPT